MSEAKRIYIRDRSYLGESDWLLIKSLENSLGQHETEYVRADLVKELVKAVNAFIVADTALVEWDANDYSPDPIGNLIAEKAHRFIELKAALKAVEAG